MIKDEWKWTNRWKSSLVAAAPRFAIYLRFSKRMFLSRPGHRFANSLPGRAPVTVAEVGWLEEASEGVVCQLVWSLVLKYSPNQDLKVPYPHTPVQQHTSHLPAGSAASLRALMSSPRSGEDIEAGTSDQVELIVDRRKRRRKESGSVCRS
eukprot:NODE_2899_length_1018_cov_5.659443_g2424_i0.p1 GENE.NODE_2899_length_1018_cov_5.659443_g2424_i0~~NODE_2899_length_1018_cov_5.659443_g2424_i0.p1  ORF type:complete len:151 (+),score=6.25 NODE_2899_length_1018_cov_5.659443_g2424_i0:361-813(+)